MAAELDRYCQNGGLVGVMGHPVVGASAREGYHVVNVPNEELAAELAGKLAKIHTGNFLILGGPEGLLTSDDPIRGYQRGLKSAGLPTAEVVRTGFDRAGGYVAGLSLASRILDAPQPAQASKEQNSGPCILAVNDVMAIGVVAALRAEGLRIPYDALIAGFDDIETLRDFRPALSTVHLPLEEFGKLAVLGSSPGWSADNEAAAHTTVSGHVALRRSTETLAFPKHKSQQPSRGDDWSNDLDGAQNNQTIHAAVIG